MVEATVLALNCERAVGEVFNVGTGKVTSVNQLMKIFAKLMRRSGVKPRYVAQRKGEIRNSQADIRKATGDLGLQAESFHRTRAKKFH